MICVDRVSFAYPGQRPLLSDVSLTLRTGETVALIGPNGSGKSTLTLLLNGLLKPAAGKITVDDMDTNDPTRQSEIRRHVGILFQNPEHQIVADTVVEEIAFGLELLNMPRAEMQRRVAELLNEFDLQSLAHRHPEELSGGEKQRLAIAATLATGVSYLVLDEPTALLDREGCDTLFRLIDRLRHDKGILFITPFPEETSFAERLLYLDSGTLREIPHYERESFCAALENDK
jgi:energy-coupling factor transport system ATP-binding protein